MNARSWIVSMVLVLAACKGGGKPSPGGGGDKTAAKLQPYIECLNRHSERVLAAANRYVDSTGGKPPTAAKGASLVSQYTDDVERCTKGIAAAKGKPPANPELETAADEYAQALTAVVPLIEQLVPTDETTPRGGDRRAAADLRRPSS